MIYLYFLIPLISLILLTAWIWAICDALRKEHSYFWLVLLVCVPPISIPLYIVNFFFLDDQKTGLSAMVMRRTTWKRIAALEEKFRTEEDVLADREEVAELYFSEGKYQEALQHLALAIDHDPENKRLQYLAARALLAQRNIERALPHLQFIVEEEPRYDTWRAMLLLAQTLEFLGRKEEALRHYNHLAEAVRQPEILYHVARAYWGTEHEPRARKLLTELITAAEGEPKSVLPREERWIHEARKLLQNGK